MNLPFLDLLVILVYLLGTVGFGCWFYFRSRSPEGFTSAGGSLPSVVVGLSIFGTYVSSISFLALPGKAFASNWNVFGLSLTIPLAAWIATRWFVPFYREVGAISAYAHLEDRFGTWARVYASVCYMLTQVARMGSVLFLLALPLHHLLGWDVRMIILVVGGLTAFYSMLGGIAGVIWTDAVQSVILIVGAATCAILLVFSMPEGPGQLFRIAAAHHKFSLGSFSLTDWNSATFWVVIWYGMAINLQNFGIDQNYVQRYLTAKSVDDARKSVWLGALLYLPISAFFLFIGTALFAFYTAQPQLLTDPQLVADVAAGKGDGVFPFFIVHQLPVGVTGLLIAAILAAAMSTIGTSMNGCATLTLTDFYLRFFRKNASKREQMGVLYAGSFLWGAVGIGCAIWMIHAKGILDAYWMLAGIFSGGMVGIFLLGFLSRRATGTAALVGAVAGVLVITWMTLSMPKVGLIPEAWRCPWNELMITVCGTVTILLTGFALTLILGEKKCESVSE
ncbi:MAG: sodium:solute symporter [Planctomycetia bacterium]|nr:sodium:solute symporter [Planctomycetia bacterium]